MTNIKKDIIIVVLILLLTAAISFYLKDHNTFVRNVDLTQVATTTEPVTETIPEESSTSTMTVKVALLGAQMDNSDKANFRGCDLLVMSDREVPYSSTPLNSAMQELFSKKDIWMAGELAPGNFIASQKDLFFDRATVTDGVAKIYLIGKIGPLGGVCDDPRLKIQIEETAKQFPSVKSVVVYVNNVQNDLIFSEKGI